MAAQMEEDDFANFLDLDLDLNFASYKADGHGDLPEAQDLAQVPQQHGQPTSSLAMADGIAQPQHIFDFSVPMDVQFPLSQNSNGVPHTMMPPTPTSMELHANSMQYLQQFEAAAHQALMSQYSLKKPENAFTPVTSPLAPNQDVNFAGSFTVPGAYFSPLTSPALEGQSHPYYANTSASSAATNSPTELDMEMGDMQGVPGPIGPPMTAPVQAATPSSMKLRKRPNPARSASTTSLTQSPSTTKSSRTRKERNVRNSVTWSAPLSAPGPTSTSSTDSITPEPLTEPAMGPPSQPASASQSPAIAANSRAANQRHGPATPASLMRMRQTHHSPQHALMPSPPVPSTNRRDPSLPPLSLPEAATVESLEIDTSVAAAASPGSSSRKTPKLGPLSTPSGSVTPGATAHAANSTSATNSPLTANFPPGRKPDAKSRSSKKRGSLSNSNLVSPALRPKISPSIKPLLPEGGGSDTHTAFLATRSNYQNLIEGTHVPGVSYPSELSTNLTSKRTSHKLAEQGRRNRINQALQEMHKLLPGSSPQPRESQSPKDDEGGAKSESGKANSNSKAATVESAIEYIKSLKWKSEQMAEVAREKDKECEELRKKLEGMEKMLSAKGLNPP